MQRKHPGEFCSEEQDDGWVIHPQQQDDDRRCRSVGEAHIWFGNIKADRKFADHKKKSGQKRPDKGIFPFDYGIRENLVNNCEQACNGRKNNEQVMRNLFR